MMDFTTVTEMPGVPITKEAVAMLERRYGLAGLYTKDKVVLEVGCGPGQGLEWLAQSARAVVAGDVEPAMLTLAARQLPGGVGRFDAEHLPFQDGSIDVVVAFEMIYYLDLAGFLTECKRVLAPAGLLIISTPNKEWSGFHPSPYSTTYHNRRELEAVAMAAGFGGVVTFTGFPSGNNNLDILRTLASFLHLIPGSIRAKAVMKRLFYGPLTEAPESVRGYFTPDMVSEDRQSKILYAVALQRSALKGTEQC